MKTTILFLITLIPVAATAALYDFLEPCANMVEMLLIPFTTDKTAGGALTIGGPVLVLFIAVGVGVFITVPLVASSIAACLGGWGLRHSGQSVSNRSALLAIFLSAAFTFTLVLAASQRDGLIPVSRPVKRPKTPAAVLACIAGGNAALSLFVATLILCRITANRKPPPIPQSFQHRLTGSLTFHASHTRSTVFGRQAKKNQLEEGKKKCRGRVGRKPRKRPEKKTAFSNRRIHPIFRSALRPDAPARPGGN